MVACKLKAILMLRGKQVNDLCETLGISRSAWFRKTKGITDFTRSEIAIMARYLELDEAQLMEIFFDDVVASMQQKEV